MTTDAPQRSPEWYAARKGRLTGSIAGAALGVSPNMTRAQCMRMMVRDALGAPRETSEFLENTIMTHGRFHESGALVDYQLETGNKVEECGFFPYEDWSGASPDGLIGDDGLLEAKVPWGKRKDETASFKSINDMPHYYAQVQLELLATGRKWAHFWQSSAHGNKLETVLPDQDWLDENMPKLRQFFAEYLHEVAENADEHLGPLRVEIDTPEASRMIREWDELAEQADRIAERKADLLKEMVALAKERDALISGRKLTLTRKSGAISYKKALDHYAPGADTSKFKGKDSEYWGLR